MLNTIKKYLGIVWMMLALVALFLLINSAFHHIKAGGKLDINKPMPWVIIIAIFTPISFGLLLFGYYCIKDEYKIENE